MLDIAEAMTDLAERLTAAGVRAVIDARDVNPPCALVAAPVFRWTFGRRLQVEWRLIVIVPSSGAASELRALGDLIERASDALDGAPETATPAAYADPGGGDQLPAYALTWTAKTSKEG